MKILRFSKYQRLLNKSQYSSVFNASDKASQPFVLALYKTNETLHGRLGIVVGKRISKLAVIRNQIKRVIRESFRLHQGQLKGLDIVVIARQHCGNLDKIQLRKSVDKLWQKFSQLRPQA